ncbi:MAG: DUF3795 domain-containing protein [Phycisphaerales bacterium]|nr:MAG: DUF3795 domain-containing protein [Phycisphaerales bacterium]
MEHIIAKCGYRCDLCLSYEANLNGDADRQRMSEALAKYYGYTLPPEQIRPCKGCGATADAPDANCQVHPCVVARGLDNCGQCPDFGCEKLKTRMDTVEECLKRCPDVPKDDYEQFFRPYLSRGTLMDVQQAMKD